MKQSQFLLLAAACASLVLSATAEPVDGTYCWTGARGQKGQTPMVGRRTK